MLLKNRSKNQLSFCKSWWTALAMVLSLLTFLFVIQVENANAQAVCLPLPRLLTTMPMGGAAGSDVEILVTGEHVDNATSLLFSSPDLVAKPKVDGNGNVEPSRFTVTIAKECKPGLYEARLGSPLGVSSSRMFSVDSLQELTQTTPNTMLASAMAIQVNTITNSIATAKSVDYYFFEAIKGHRYIIHCSSRGIDSKLEPVVIIGDSEGRDIMVERRGDVLDYVATVDGKHVIKVHELTFKGGPAYFYRLSLQEIALNATLPQFASTKTVSSFSWPPVGLASQALRVESEPNNNAAVAEKIELPCDLSGAFFPAADVDSFEFTASKGETWWVEIASERLGRPTDPSILVQHVGGEPGKDVLTDVAEFSDIASPVKPSTNGYAYDGPPYDGGSTDILGKLEIKQDGVHRLQLTDLFGGTRNDARNIYRLIIRKAMPDFALAAWGLHMELRNGDRNALSKPLALRAGATVALEVVALRRDGFEGEIELRLDGLPDGVTAQGLKIPSGSSRGMMLITAHPEAPTCLVNLTFAGSSVIDQAPTIRPVHMAEMAWPIPDAWNDVPSPRLVGSIPLSVTSIESAPLSIAMKDASVIEATVGGKLTIPLIQTKRCEFSGTVLQMKAFGDGFDRIPPFNLSLDSANSEAIIDLAALKTTPGEYRFAFYGGAVAKYRLKPDSAPQDTVEIVVSEPITIRVKPVETK